MLPHPTIETFTLTETKDKKITLTAYVAGVAGTMPFNDKRRAVIVCPGGAYRGVSSREAEPIATAFLAAGINAFVLDYSVTNENEEGKCFPGQLIEAAMAMKFIKDNAERFHVDPDKIFINGYSAGGHLAASFGTLYNSDYVKNALDVKDGELRPAGMILAYPVITAGDHAHLLSFEMILGNKVTDPEARRAVSIECQVNESAVPAFIWHTRTDAGVPVQNSIVLAKALADHGVPFELHVYPNGPHGMSLANDIVGSDDPYVAQWFPGAVRWMKNI